MISKSVVYFLSICCFFSISSTLAQNNQLSDPITFQHIKDGMSQSSATHILEDKYGFLWIGTPNGINRFDGTDFQIYEKSTDGITGLSDGYIESIFEDEDGNLLVGTNQGLNIYDRKLNLMKPFPFMDEGQFIQSKYISTINRVDDQLWLGTDNNGVYKYDLNTGKARNLTFEQIYNEGPNNNYIEKIFILESENILVFTQASIYVIDPDLNIINSVKEPQNISSVIQADENTFWIGSYTGVIIRLKLDSDLKFDLNTVSISPGYTILSLELDDFGNVWAGSENDGLTIYNPSTKDKIHLSADVRKPNSVSSNSIWSLHKSKNGVMWMGPFKQGLSFYDPLYYKFRHIQTDPFSTNSLSNNIVNCFIEDVNENLWIGTDGGGLNYWDREENTFEHYALSNGKFNSNVVLALLRDDKQNLWIGTWANGLTVFNSDNGIIRTFNTNNSLLGSNNVIALHQDRKGFIWIVTLFGGVHVFDPVNDSYKHVRLESTIDDSGVITMARILEDSKGNIWVGTQLAGLFKLEEIDGSWQSTHYYSQDQNRTISNDFINTMIEDVEGNIWIGTQAGLCKYDPISDSFSTTSKSDGLIDDAIKGIIRDKEGYLWLSTSKGIIRYNPSDGETLNYDQNDGLQGNEFNAASFYTTSKGELLFGGGNGFNIFTPKDASKLDDKPAVYISSFSLFNQPVIANDATELLAKDISQTDSIEIRYDQSVIGFDFRALTFRHPEKVAYAYFLDGFENDWNYVGNDGHATYTNLSPGWYTLRLKSTNADGVWNDQETRLSIHVTPPFWLTWWFSILIFLMFLTLLIGIYRIRDNAIKNRQIELENEINLRTSELQVQTKKLVETANELSGKNEEIQQFAFSVSHDLKSPLNSIIGISDLISMEINSGKPNQDDLKEYLSLIKRSCKMMNTLITDITKMAKLGRIENEKEQLDTQEIIKTSTDLVFGRLQDKNVKLSVSEDLPGIYGDKNRMIQVFENLIDNAVKYMGAQSQPEINISFIQQNGKNQFIVKDNGTGMDKYALQRLFSPFQRFSNDVEGTGLGLYMIKQIVESHGGEITADSEGKGKGSTFTVSLPKA